MKVHTDVKWISEDRLFWEVDLVCLTFGCTN